MLKLRCPRGRSEHARPPGHTLTDLWHGHIDPWARPVVRVHSPLTCCADQTCNLEPENPMSNGNGTSNREHLSGQILARIPEPSTLHQVTAGMKGDWGIGEGETNGIITDLAHAGRLEVLPGVDGGPTQIRRTDALLVPPVASRDAEGVNLHEALLDLVAAEPRSRDKLVQAARKQHGGEIPDWTRRLGELERTGRLHLKPKGKGHQYTAGRGPDAAPTGDARVELEAELLAALSDPCDSMDRAEAAGWLSGKGLAVPDAQELIQRLLNTGRLFLSSPDADLAVVGAIEGGTVDSATLAAGDAAVPPESREPVTGPPAGAEQPDLFDEPDDVRQLRIESKALARVQQLLQGRQYQRDRIKDLKEEMSAAKESLAGIEAQLDTFDFPKAPAKIPASAPTICKVEPVDVPLPLGPPTDPQPVAPEARLDLPEHTPENPQPFTEREGEIFEGALETSTHGDGTGGEGHDVRTHGDGSRDLDAEQAEMDREMAHQD